MGATGFTGGLVAAYLAEQPEPVRWAMAGRDLAKLERVRSELGLGDTVTLLRVDSFDVASLDAMTARTRVVCTTVGPYAKYGTELVRSCVRNGTACCDLTGEPLWMARLIAELQDAAEASGARIVNACGFDSIPSDVGCFLLQRAFAERGTSLASARMRITKMRGGVSGGTLDTMVDTLREARDPKVRKQLLSGYALYPAGVAPGPKVRGAFKAALNAKTGRWEIPFFMGLTNSQVVRRTNALTGFPYGEDFTYEEVMQTGRGLQGRTRAWAMMLGLSAVTLGMSMPVTRKLLLATLLPRPGEGPDEASRNNGCLRATFDGVGQDGTEAAVHLSLDKDPGYGATAMMLGEAALALAKTDGPGGIHTPMSGLGDALVTRLRAVGLGVTDDG